MTQKRTNPPASTGGLAMCHQQQALDEFENNTPNLKIQQRRATQNPRWAFGRRGRAGLIAVFSPVLCHAVGAGALAGRAIAILSIVFGFGEAFFARLPGQRLL